MATPQKHIFSPSRLKPPLLHISVGNDSPRKRMNELRKEAGAYRETPRTAVESPVLDFILDYDRGIKDERIDASEGFWFDIRAEVA